MQQEARLACQRDSPYATFARKRDRMLTLLTSKSERGILGDCWARPDSTSPLASLVCIIVVLAFLNMLRIPSERSMVVAIA